MQQQTVDESILQQLRRILSFDFLSRNYFLLRKFDPNSGYVMLQSLAKEKSFRPLIDYPYGIEALVNILIQYNYSNWIFDQTFNVVRPIFAQERKQVQILIKKNQVDDFKTFLQELDLVKECEVQEAEYIANKDMIKLFIIFDNEDEAQMNFSKIQQQKATYSIQNAKMEEVDYFTKFLNIVQSKQQQFQEYRMNNPRNYEDRQAEDQQFSHQQTQNQQQQKFYQHHQQEKQQQQDYTSSDIVNQRLNQIRSSDRIEFNYAPLQEQQSLFSFVPLVNPTQQVAVQYSTQFIEKKNSIEILPSEVVPECARKEDAEQIETQNNQMQITRETESNKENSVERNNQKSYSRELYQEKQHFKPGYQQNGYQQKRRNNYDYNQSKYHNNRKPQYYSIKLSNLDRLEDDLKEFTGYKKYQQRQQKEYYELKKEY
ncbi:unnamed protein product (macronuclear) [Paramecium tetraurelia]|uniref:HTH La-type RNA-binding domain-containing protein n=1 Tax=Paramecium tetraurelia TaxID=5888 RepID=A0EER8_PARTE|nr:uncharacterized protein GSPATT00026132001 [Paramecium tetraurelia]CAK93809.1 unnamed protein product [Paramecium tetraurelia]|eukprot:XP_001461182.1 hypothetical protein (macronuclear) [Paramecium tetraurelia strain d4-2]